MATTIAATWYSPALTITDTLTTVTINSTETVYLTSTTYNDSGTTVGRQLRFAGYKDSHDLANFKLWLADTTDVLTSCVRDVGHNMAVLLENNNALVIPQTAKNALIYNPTTKAFSKSVACSGYSDGVVRQGSVVLVPKTANTIKILDETGKGLSTNLQIQMPNPGPTVEYVFESTAATLLVLENPKFTSASDITTTTTYGWGTSIGWNITASSFNGVEVPFRAFDKTFSGFWATAPNKFDGSGYLTNVNDPQWIAMAFPEQVVMKSFSIQFNNESYYTRAGPREFSIQGSNDRSTWTNIKSYTEVTGWSAGQLREFTDIPTTFPSFSNFRILLERSNGHHLITIGEIKFFTSKTVNTTTDTSGNSYLLTLPVGGNLISDFKTIKALQVGQGTVAETAVLTSLAETNGGEYYINNNTISFDIYLSAATGTSTTNTTGINILSFGIDNGNSSTQNLTGTAYGYKFSYFTNTLNYTVYGNDVAGTKLGVSSYGAAVSTGRWIHYDIVWGTSYHPDVYQDGSLLTKTVPNYTGSPNLRLKHGIGNKTILFHGSGVTGHRFANFRMYQRQLSATERNCLQSFPSVVNGYRGYSGGALTSDNNVVLAPAQANAIAIVSPTNGVTFVTPIIAPFISTDTVFNSSKYSGAVTLQNGKIMFVPNNATKIGLLTLPSTFAEDAAVTLATPTYDKYSGGVLMQDGRVLLVPSGATTVGIYNPTIATPTFVNGPAATGYSGGTLLNDGRVLLFPKTAPKVAIYNPFSNSITEMSNLTNITDMLYLADNTTFVLQDKATSVSIYQPRDIKANETDIIEVGPAATGYKTQVRQTDGRIIFMNNTTATVAVYNPINNKVFTQAASVSYINALPVSDGTFIQGPFNNTRVGRYTNVINGAVPTIKSTYPQVLYSKVFVKGQSSFFLTADNKLYASGAWNNNGQLGIPRGPNVLGNTVGNIPFPKRVDTSALIASNAGEIIDIATGYNISFILTFTGKVFYTYNSTFIEMSLTPFGAGTVTQISTFYTNTIFLTSLGKAFVAINSSASPGAVDVTNIGASGFITQVSAGNTHYLLLRDGGTPSAKVFSYGNNTDGQCGRATSGAAIAIPTEIDMTNILSDSSSSYITAISAGMNFSLFLTNEGKVFSCGFNGVGQLGINSIINTAIPTQIIMTNITNASDGTILKISGGMSQSLFLTSTNKVYACGLNNHGQLGINSYTNVSIPTLVNTTNLTAENAGTITDIYAGGDSHTALFTSSGKSFASGSKLNTTSGFLGTLDTIASGTPDTSTIPIRTVVSDLDGYLSGVLLNSGKVLLVPTSKASDVRILNTTDNTTTIPTISLGGKISGFSCGISLSNGNVLLVPSTTSRIGLYNPITDTLSQVANVNTYIRSSVNEFHSLFLRSDGKVFAVGFNDSGQLGINSTTNTSTPTMIDITHIGKYGVITKIAAGSGYSNSYFLRSDGKAFACGFNSNGTCGVGYITTAVLIPTPIDTTNIGSTTIIKDIFAENRGVWFLTNNGKVFFAGYNAGGRGLISASSGISVPTQIDTTNIGPTGEITQVAASQAQTYFLRSDGAVFRSTSATQIPTQITVGVAGVDIVKQIAYKNLAIFLTTNNKLFSCLGTAAVVGIDTTAFLAGDPAKTILKIAVGTLNAMVLRSDGKVFAIPTGSNGNAFGESGIGVSTTAVTTFTEIITTNIGTRPIIDISCGYYSAFFTRDDNTIFSCGRDTYGELGLKSINTIVTIPTEVSPRVGYKHGVQVNDGRVVLFSDIDDSVCIYTPDTNTVLFPTTNIKGATYANSTLAPNGKIILTPESATTVGIYTPSKANTINGSSKVTGLLTMTNTVPEPSNTVLNPQNSAKFIKWLTAITSVRYGSWWNSATKPLFSVGATKTPVSSFTYVGSVLLKDGRVLFVQSASAATNALIYTPLTNTVALSTGGVAGFQGGVLLANGDVLLVPRTPSGVRIYNPNTNAISGAIGSATGYFGGVLLPNKNVLLVPYSATTIGIYNTAGASFATAAGITLTGGYIGGVLLSDGRVVFVPYIATTVGVYDPISNLFSQNITVPALATNDRYSGGVLLPDGRVLFVPYSATNIGIYDPFANKGRGSFTTGPAIAGGAKYTGGVLLPDGRVLFIPFNARNVGIYDPITNLFTTPIMYDAATNTNTDLDLDCKYWGGSLLPDGRVVMAPQSATKVGIVSGFPTPKSEMCYHPCFNKF